MMVQPLAFIGGGFGPQEILLILLILLLLFGGKKLPELARSLGKSLSEFRRGREEGELEEASRSKKADAGGKTESDKAT